jgi:hypothetical protein
VIKIAITVETFDALASTLPFGTGTYEKNLDAKGECPLWLEPMVVDRLRFLRGQGESFSDVILRLVETEEHAACSHCRQRDRACRTGT